MAAPQPSNINTELIEVYFQILTAVEYIQKAIRRGGLWSRRYCVSTVGMNEKAILQYVEHREKEDKGQLTMDIG